MYSDDERPLVADVVHRMVNRAIEMEGTVTGEHGVGLVKRDYLPLELGQDTVDAMRRVVSPSSAHERADESLTRPDRSSKLSIRCVR